MAEPIKTKIVVLVYGGSVMAVYSDKSLSEIDVTVVDQDNIDAGDQHPFASNENFEAEMKHLHQVF